VVLSTTAGQPVRLRDVGVARLVLSRQGGAGVARPGGDPTPAVLLLVRPAPGAAAAVTAAVGRLTDGRDWNLLGGATVDRLAFGPGDTTMTLRLPAGAGAGRGEPLSRETAAADAEVPRMGVW